MVNDPKVKCSAKKPQQRCKPGESYDSANARWRARWCEYQDAYAMAWCMAYASPLCRAYYGMTASEMCDAHLGN